MTYDDVIGRFAKQKGISLHGDVEIKHFIETHKKELDEYIENIQKSAEKKKVIRELNKKRDKELQGFVLDDIFMNEDVIKTMAVAYNVATDDEIIQWIDINNQVVDFSKVDFGALIKQGSTKVKEIYFKYRQLKDQVA